MMRRNWPRQWKSCTWNWKNSKQRGVHVIVREGDQYVAVIGDRMLHVGDEINGFTVTAIDPDGVHVERKESP